MTVKQYSPLLEPVAINDLVKDCAQLYADAMSHTHTRGRCKAEGIVPCRDEANLFLCIGTPQARRLDSWYFKAFRLSVGEQ